MHGRRIKDDKVNYPVLLYNKNNEDDFPSAQKSSPPPSQRHSLFRSQCFHYMTELSPTTTCRWRDDTFLEKIELSSHPSVYHSIHSRRRFVRFPYVYRDMRGSESKRRKQITLPGIENRQSCASQKLPSARSCALLKISRVRRETGHLANCFMMTVGLLVQRANSGLIQTGHHRGLHQEET